MNRFKQMVKMKLRIVKPLIEEKAVEMKAKQQSHFELCKAAQKLADMDNLEMKTMAEYRILVDFDIFVIEAKEITFTALGKETALYLVPLSKETRMPILDEQEEQFFSAFEQFRNNGKPLIVPKLMNSTIDERVESVKEEIEIFNFVDGYCDSPGEQEELDRLTDFFINSEDTVEIKNIDDSYNDEHGNVKIENPDIEFEEAKFQLSFVEECDKEKFIKDFIEGYTPKAYSFQGLALPHPIKHKPVVTNEGDFFLLKWEIE